MNNRIATCALLSAHIMVTAVWANEGDDHSACRPLTQELETKLTKHVKELHNLPDDLDLTGVSIELTTGCYRRVRFSSRTPGRPFEIELALSPDQRFLASSVYEVRSNPEHARSHEKKVQWRRMTDSAPRVGASEPKSSVVIFSDFQCRYCKLAAKTIATEILPEYGDRVQFVYRHLPLSGHTWARPAAEAAACGMRQGNRQFWEMHDAIFAAQDTLSDEGIQDQLLSLASKIDLIDVHKFSQCLAKREGASLVLGDENLAMSSGAQVTPTLVIDGKQYRGMQSAAEFKNLLNKHLQGTSMTNGR